MDTGDLAKLEQIAQLKARIPNVQCKGLCFRVCATTAMTNVEHAAIEERHGIHILRTPVELAVKHKLDTPCAALKDRRCQIWEDKEVYPTVCSAFGAVEHMPCPFGCVPEAGYMSLEEYKLLQADIDDIGGSPDSTLMGRIRLRQLLDTRTGRRRYREHVFAEMEHAYKWWRNYVATNPDGLDLGGPNDNGHG